MEAKEMKKFITFEGIDGSGKTTILHLVADKLRENGFNVIETFEPTDTWLGDNVKKCIEEDTDPFITTFAFIADRIQHGKQIEEWLREGRIVLCDRYVDSTYAYQGVQLRKYMKQPIKWLKELSSNIPIPDRTFLFILDPKEALERIQSRENLIPFEKISFLTKVQENYEKLAEEDKRFMIIDASKTIDEIVDICYRDIVKG
ncbi:MAG: dTMP kinase [Thermoplasmata archaeon]|nr:MAG: dTMP kinase [Thermoplasmata archaeon]